MRHKKDMSLTVKILYASFFLSICITAIDVNHFFVAALFGGVALFINSKIMEEI